MGDRKTEATTEAGSGAGRCTIGEKGGGSLDTEQRTGRRRLWSPAPGTPSPRQAEPTSKPPPPLQQLRGTGNSRRGCPPAARPEHKTSVHQRCGAPGLSTRCSLRTSPEPLSVPGLRLEDPEQHPAALGGLHRRSKPRSRPVTTKPGATGRPTHRVGPGVADRRGRGVRTRLRGGDQPPQRCPGPRIRPPGRRPVSQPRPHPASPRGSARPAPPRPPGSAAASELSKPLVFVLSLRRPQGAGRVTPRGGILSR